MVRRTRPAVSVTNASCYGDRRERFAGTGLGGWRGVGFVLNIRFSTSSNEFPSSLGSPLGEFGEGSGFDGFPDFVARNLGSIGEPLASDVHKDSLSALHVVHTKGHAVIPAKIELGRVALQMLFADAMEGAIQATFEDRKR